jgi:hypothetical protein
MLVVLATGFAIRRALVSRRQLGLQMRDYCVVTRASSAVHFRQTANVLVSATPESTIPIKNLDIRSLYSGDKPGQLQCVIRGHAESVEEAVTLFANLGGEFLQLMALIGNAAVLKEDLALVYETTEDAAKKDFFQRLKDSRTSEPIVFRIIDPQWLLEAHRLIQTHQSAHRIQRAIAHYAESLRVWHPMDMIRPATYLFMAVEAVGKVIEDRLLVEHACTKHDLAVKWGFEPKDESDRSHLWHFDGELRRRHIFEGNIETYQKLRKMSDGFEHAYLKFDHVRKLAKEAAEPAAISIRSAILREIGICAKTASTLNSQPFATFLAGWAPVLEIEGHWAGSESGLQPGEAPVELHAQIELSGRMQDGVQGVQFQSTIKFDKDRVVDERQLFVAASRIALPGRGALDIDINWE